PIPDQVIGARDRRVNLRMRIVVNGDGVRSITRGGWFARPVMRRVGGKETTESTEDTEQCRRSVRNPKSETSNSNGLFFLCALCVLCALCGQLVFDRLHTAIQRSSASWVGPLCRSKTVRRPSTSRWTSSPSTWYSQAGCSGMVQSLLPQTSQAASSSSPLIR